MTKALRIDERKLRIIMATRGIDTLQELSEKSGVSYSTLYNVLNGAPFRSVTLQGLAQALEVNPVDLMVIEGYPVPHVDAPAIA